jgi:hypothetical protein
MGTLVKLIEEYDLVSAGEYGPVIDFGDSVALTVKASLDGKYEKPAGNPNQVGSKRRKRAA